jgi:hypothetical protein
MRAALLNAGHLWATGNGIGDVPGALARSRGSLAIVDPRRVVAPFGRRDVPFAPTSPDLLC